MIPPEEWATKALKTIFRKDFEKLIAEIQEDARLELDIEILMLETENQILTLEAQSAKTQI